MLSQELMEAMMAERMLEAKELRLLHEATQQQRPGSEPEQPSPREYRRPSVIERMFSSDLHRQRHTSQMPGG